MNSIAHKSNGMTKVTTQEFRRYQDERGEQRCGKECGRSVCMAMAAVVHVHENHSTSVLAVYTGCAFPARECADGLPIGASRSKQPLAESHLTSPQTGA
jgi:hypothetical protein